MKKIYVVLCNAIMCALRLCSMEIDLSQSMVEFPQSSSPKHNKKTSKTLSLAHQQKQSINLLAQKSTQKKIKSLATKIDDIDQLKQQQYKSIIDNISSMLEKPKKLTSNKLIFIDYTLDIINGENIRTIIQDLNQQQINLVNKLNILTALYNLPQPNAYQEIRSSYQKPQPRERTIIKNEQDLLSSWLTIKAEIATALNTLELQYKNQLIDILKKEEMPLKILRMHKKILEQSIDQLKNAKTPEDVTKKNKSQEIINTISHQIDLFTAIDKQLLIDYSSLDIEQLFDYIESLTRLRSQLNNFDTQRYKNLNTTIQKASSNLHLKRQEKVQKEELEMQTRLRQIELEEGKKLDEMIKEEEKKQQREAREKQRIREEQEKRKQEMSENLAQLERARLERKQLEQQEAQRLEQDRIQQENAKRWIPWIINRFNQTRQTVFNFVNGIGSTITSWWSWLTGK